MISSLLSRLIILVFGNLYPAYDSYKAVKTKNVKEYVKWMMYWIVFAFFTCLENCTDIFLSWFPFYYEIKVLIIIWLLSPATKGSSMIYRKFVHPMLTRREEEIDEYLNQAKERGYSALLHLGSKGINYASSVIMQTAIRTIQYSINAAKGSEISHMLTTSQSEGVIHHRSPIMYGDAETADMIESRYIDKSRPLDTVSAFRTESSVDNQLKTVQLPLIKARICESPVRKVKERRSWPTVLRTKCNRLSAIRARQKIREATLDTDIEVE